MTPADKKQFTFTCAPWPSMHTWLNEHPKKKASMRRQWLLGSSKKRGFWAGAAGEIKAQWCNAGRPKFTGPVMVDCQMYFEPPRKGRDKDRHVPIWLLDLLRHANTAREATGVHLGIISEDNHTVCDYRVEIHEGADETIARVTITEV